MLSSQFLKLSAKISLRGISTSALSKCQSKTSSTNPLVLVDVDDKSGYATLSLNRPPVNSFNLELLSAFSKALDEVAQNKSKGMILTSVIPNIFSVGFDLRELCKPDKQKIREFWSTAQDCWVKLYGSYYPTVAAINGHNPAAGCFFSMACEYRVMVPNSKIGLSGARLGIAMPYPIILTMKNIISSRQAELAITSGTLFSSEEALKIGLIDEIATDKADAITKSIAFLDRFKKIPPMARGMTKQLIRKNDIEDIMKNRERDIDEWVASIESPEAQKSFEVFLDSSKRKSS